MDEKFLDGLLVTLRVQELFNVCVSLTEQHSTSLGEIAKLSDEFEGNVDEIEKEIVKSRTIIYRIQESLSKIEMIIAENEGLVLEEERAIALFTKFSHYAEDRLKNNDSLLDLVNKIQEGM